MCRHSLTVFACIVSACFFFNSSPALGQNQDAQLIQVSGRVLNSATGESVPGATVQISGAQARALKSDSSGHFTAEGFPAGQATIFALKQGFAPITRPHQVVVAAGMDPIVLKLDPLCRISGRILDSDGEPIEGMLVQALRQMIVNGRKQWTPTQSGATDEAGNFEIDDVSAAPYILVTQQKPVYIAIQQKSEAARLIYPKTYYPDVPTRDLAQQINLLPGQQFQLQMSMHALRAAHVSLTTLPRFRFVMASISEEDEQQDQGFAQSDQSTGVLTLGAVPPGHWKLVVRGPFGENNNESMYGELPLDVAGTDLNVTVPLSKLPDILVQEVGGNANIQLMSKMGPMGYNVRDAGGQLKLTGAQPGHYRIITNAGGTSCVTSITAGSEDLMREELVVAAGSTVPQIQVVSSDNCPTLSATVSTKSQATLIAVSSQAGMEPRTIGVGPGEATIQYLSPGDYTIYAFDDVSDLEYANPEVMRSFKGQQVHLQAGQKATVALELNQRLSQ